MMCRAVTPLGYCVSICPSVALMFYVNTDKPFDKSSDFIASIPVYRAEGV